VTTRPSQEGKCSDGLYIALAGAFSAEAAGKSWPISLGQMFGQQSLLTSAPSKQTVTAVRESVVLRLPATRVRDDGVEVSTGARGVVGAGRGGGWGVREARAATVPSPPFRHEVHDRPSEALLHDRRHRRSV
jgi:CRP-like cAMP-binding protein